MNTKSSEFTGDLFTKSESRTEDVIAMVTKVQEKYTHKFTNTSGSKECFERKVLSGDNKTEKNTYYGIFRLVFFLNWFLTKLVSCPCIVFGSPNTN